jgi:hypothetical protein
MTRQELVNSGHLIFTAASQSADLLDPAKTQTCLIAYLSDLITQYGHHIQVTAINTDHPSWDGGPTGRGHNAGCALDGWPLSSATANDYVDASAAEFQQFLQHAAASQPLYQIGLQGNGAGDPTNYADSPANFAAAGPTAFEDHGTGPHVHLGANPA